MHVVLRRMWSPSSTRLAQLAATLLAAAYMLFVGGTFAATLVFEVKRLNLLLGGGLALIWLLVRLKQRRPLRATGIEWALLAFVLSQWVAVLTSAQPRLGLDWAASLFVWFAVLMILADLLANGWPRAYLLNSLVLLAIVLVANGVWTTAQWFGRWAALGVLPPVAFRYDGLLEQANLAACVINLLWPVVLLRSLQIKKRAGRVALHILIAGLLVLEFFTSSRAGWIAAAAALATIGGLLATKTGTHVFWARLRSLWQQQRLLSRILLVMAALAIIVGTTWLLTKETQVVTHGNLFQSRDTFWSAAWSLFLAHPLTGSGPELFPWYYPHFVSIPPEFFPPSAHSVLMQVLSGSGLLGIAALATLAAILARRLWGQWRATGGSIEAAALAAALVSFGVHGLFDYPITIFILMLLAIVTALALAPTPGAIPAKSSDPAPRTFPPALAMAVIVVPVAVFAFILRGASINAAGLALADSGQWQAAAVKFEQSARLDPGLTLYWEEAAYAYTRAGAVSTALPIWRRAAQDDPYWALVPANIGAISNDLRAAQTAHALAPESHLFALNAGAVAEVVGDQAATNQDYQTALDLKPSIATALFWQQTPLRAQALENWRARQAQAGSTLLSQAQAALDSGNAAAALPLFDRARVQDPQSNAPYLGLVRSNIELHDYGNADHYLQAGLSIPVVAFEDTLGLYVAQGDLAEARGDRGAAMAAYSGVFAAIDDYDIGGPGSLGFPQRSRIVFHEVALPAEIVPQMAHADITADMDARFAQLAQWELAAGQNLVGCHVLERVHREAPISASGRLYVSLCPAT
jgi:tetratricopeptide (TPR) repeat protein